MNPLITVIVPVYNVERYLKRSVDCLLSQKYDNIEIFLVDDGSTDNCGRICDEFATKDSRIKVIHKANGGQSSARNMALDRMNGEYVTFIDSDDYVDEDYIQYLYDLLTDNNADISMSEHYYVDESDKIIGDSVSKTELQVFTGTEATIYQCYQKRVDNFVWGKLYKSSLFSDVRFPEGKIYEELGTNYKLYLKCDHIVKGNGSHYYYVQRSGSTMHFEYDHKKMDRIDMSLKLLEDISGISPELKKAGECRLFISAVQVLREIPLSEEYKEDYNEIEKIIKQYRKSVAADRDAKKINRIIACTAIVIGCRNIKKLGNLYKRVFPN